MRFREKGRDSSGQGRRKPIPLQTLSKISQEASERITLNEMFNLINSMPIRCQAVIGVDRIHIPYRCYISDHTGNLYKFAIYRDEVSSIEKNILI